MPFTYDPAKDVENRRKHGISVVRAVEMWNGIVVERIDDRFAYGEERIRATGMIDGILYLTVYTMRGDAHHVISLRRATRNEASHHWQKAGR